ISFARPAQRDASVPNVDLGIRYKTGGRKSGYLAPPSGEIRGELLSVGLSTTVRAFEFPPAGATNSSSSSVIYNGAYAVNAIIPIIASDDGKNMGNTLTISGEYTVGA